MQRNGSLEQSASLLEPEFDRRFYWQTYPHRAGILVDPLDHFLTVGWLQGRDPSANFFAGLSISSAIAMTGVSAAQSICRTISLSGKTDKREIFPHVVDDSIYLPREGEFAQRLSKWFDPDYYLRLNPDLDGCRNLLAQFMILDKAGRDPCANFFGAQISGKYSDGALSGRNPLIHFRDRDGREERPNPPKAAGRPWRDR